MIKEQVWILACTEQHEENIPCRGFIMTYSHGSEFLEIYRSKELAEMAAGELMEKADPENIGKPPSAVLVEISQVAS